MQKFYVIPFLLLFTFSLHAQKSAKKQAEEKARVYKNLLPDDAFDRMIIQDITYAIFGESTPASGLKVDITKPEATISAVFLSKKNPHILNGFDLKGGITDKAFSIFKGFTSFNTAYEFKYSYHYIPSINSASYPPSKKEIIRAKNALAEQQRKMITDSFHMATLIYNHHIGSIAHLIDPTALPNDATIKPEQKKILLAMIKKLMNKKRLPVNQQNTITEILREVPAATLTGNDINPNSYKDGIVEAYKIYKKNYAACDDMIMDKQISNANVGYTQKKYWWITVAPLLRTEKLNRYHTKFEGRDSLYFKSDYLFYYGAGFSLNHYIVLRDKVAHYMRAGVNFSRANNLSTLNSFNYETRTPFFTDGSSATEKIKSGAAYNHSDVKKGFLAQLSTEYYRLPLNSFYPGFYLANNINVSKLFQLPTIVGREKDMAQVGFEGGLIFNIKSREKDKEKSILSVSLFTRFEDVTDKRRTPKLTGEEEAKDKFLERNLSFGIKVGVPINLPQRN